MPGDGKLKNERVNKDMYMAVFDTTAGGVVLALYNDGNPVWRFEKLMEFGQAEELAVQFKQMLDENALSFGDIGLLGVCTGPGSFTGVRAGLAFARGLSFGAPELKITGVSAFEAYARMLRPGDLAYYNAVVIETKREDFYFQLFDENLHKISEPSALGRDEIAKMLKGRQTSFIGDGVERLLSVSLGLQIKTVEPAEILSAEALFAATRQKYLNKTLDFPKPLYIRNADVRVSAV